MEKCVETLPGHNKLLIAKLVETVEIHVKRHEVGFNKMFTNNPHVLSEEQIPKVFPSYLFLDSLVDNYIFAAVMHSPSNHVRTQNKVSSGIAPRCNTPVSGSSEGAAFERMLCAWQYINPKKDII